MCQHVQWPNYTDILQGLVEGPAPEHDGTCGRASGSEPFTAGGPHILPPASSAADEMLLPPWLGIARDVERVK